MFQILFAPLQGYTTGIFREVHALHFGGVDCYYAPFLRLENGKIRERDLQDLLKHSACRSGCEQGVNLSDKDFPIGENPIKVIPQIIAGTVQDFKILADTLEENGFNEIDFNMGCPFPMQVKRNRGAGLLQDIKTVEGILAEIQDRVHSGEKNGKPVQFSIKMRLGENSADEAFRILPLLNQAPLKHITLHPRLGKQQYKGALNFPSFEKFYSECRHPLFFNGDINDLEQIHELERLFPNLQGVMIGRGLLANPNLANEYRTGVRLQRKEQIQRILKMHCTLMDYACRTFQGDSQILSHMKNFWEYQEPNLPKKIFKRIRKAGKVEEYRSAIRELETASPEA